MATRTARARWHDDLKSGGGRMAFGSGAYEGAYSFDSRFQDGDGTSPEELLAAAHAGCFSMALSNLLSEDGHPPKSVETKAKVHLEMGDQGPSIPLIELETEGEVPGVTAEQFVGYAEKAKAGCPVSRLFQGAEIRLETSFKGG